MFDDVLNIFLIRSVKTFGKVTTARVKTEKDVEWLVAECILQRWSGAVPVLHGQRK
jgi:hypothetical protein